MKTTSLVCVLSLLFVSALPGRAAVQTVDDIVEKHLAALGGREALGKLTTRRSTGTVTISTPNGDLSGPAEISIKAPNKLRAIVTLDLTPMGVTDKLVIEQKFDGTIGWILDSMQGDREITGSQLEQMRNNVFPSALLNYKAAGTTLEVQPKAQVGGRDVIVLVAKPKIGPAVRMLLDAATYLTFRTLSTINSPEMGDLEQTSELSDYRVVDGVKVAFQIVNTNPQQTTTIKIAKVEHNVPLDDALFKAKTPVLAGR